MDFPRTRTRRAQVSLIPLIDVTMFLLIFFMVAGVIEKFEIIPVDPPRAGSGKLMDEGHITLLLGGHDEIILGDEIVTVDQVQERLREDLAINPAKVITVKADAGIPANRMIEVMDRIKLAGGRNLSVVTQSREDAGK